MEKAKNKLVEIRPEIIEAMRRNKIVKALIEAHGLAYVINRDLAKRYGVKRPLTKAEVNSRRQKERWAAHHEKKDMVEVRRLARNERKRRQRAKAKRIARKASVGSEAK